MSFCQFVRLGSTSLSLCISASFEDLAVRVCPYVFLPVCKAWQYESYLTSFCQFVRLGCTSLTLCLSARLYALAVRVCPYVFLPVCKVCQH